MAKARHGLARRSAGSFALFAALGACAEATPAPPAVALVLGDLHTDAPWLRVDSLDERPLPPWEWRFPSAAAPLSEPERAPDGRSVRWSLALGGASEDRRVPNAEGNRPLPEGWVISGRTLPQAFVHDRAIDPPVLLRVEVPPLWERYASLGIGFQNPDTRWRSLLSTWRDATYAFGAIVVVRMTHLGRRVEIVSGSFAADALTPALQLAERTAEWLWQRGDRRTSRAVWMLDQVPEGFAHAWRAPVLRTLSTAAPDDDPTAIDGGLFVRALAVEPSDHADVREPLAAYLALRAQIALAELSEADAVAWTLVALHADPALAGPLCADVALQRRGRDLVDVAIDARRRGDGPLDREALFATLQSLGPQLVDDVRARWSLDPPGAIGCLREVGYQIEPAAPSDPAPDSPSWTYVGGEGGPGSPWRRHEP